MNGAARSLVPISKGQLQVSVECIERQTRERENITAPQQLIFGPMFSGKTTELIRRVQRFKFANYRCKPILPIDIRAQLCLYAAYRCIIIKYARDNRYSASEASTHDRFVWQHGIGKIVFLSAHFFYRQTVSAMPATALKSFMNLENDYDVFGIDEGQFFPDVVEFAEFMANRGKIIVVAALDGTYRREVSCGSGDGKVAQFITKKSCRDSAIFCNWFHWLRTLSSSPPSAWSVSATRRLPSAKWPTARYSKIFTARQAAIKSTTLDCYQVELIGGEESYMAVCRGCYSHKSPRPSPLKQRPANSPRTPPCSPAKRTCQDNAETRIGEDLARVRRRLAYDSVVQDSANGHR